jgi:hypothetical protein
MRRKTSLVLAGLALFSWATAVYAATHWHAGWCARAALAVAVALALSCLAPLLVRSEQRDERDSVSSGLREPEPRPFAAILSQWQYQDQCGWQRLREALVAELGGLAVACTLASSPVLSSVILASVGVVALLLVASARKSERDRDHNLALIDRFKPDGFRLTSPHGWVKGWHATRSIFAVLVAVNVAFFVLQMRGCLAADPPANEALGVETTPLPTDANTV